MSDIVNGPDVAVIGWIPRIPPDITLLPAGYQTWAARRGFSPLRRFAMQELFGSGNPDPPNALGNLAGLQQHLASKEFRFAVALRDVSIEWGNGNQQIQFHYALNVFTGYTPVNRWTPPAGAGKQWQWQTWVYLNGAGNHSVRRRRDPQSVTITVTVRAKLTHILNVFQSFCTYHLAPWAITRFAYTVERQSGNSSIDFYGTTIPSQKFYVNWNAHSQFNMKRNTFQEIDGFITAGMCLNAPVYSLSFYP